MYVRFLCNLWTSALYSQWRPAFILHGLPTALTGCLFTETRAHLPAMETSKNMHLYLEPNTIPNPGLYTDLFCSH